MILATYIDGDEETLYGALLTRHSVSVKVKIKPEHQAEWLELLEGHCEDELSFPTDRKKPVPVTFSVDEIADMVDDTRDHDCIKPYYEDLVYMCEKDEAGMGVIYLLKDKA